ncbi:unnamed protein product [Bursaphelenchus okinawaensis]|uniref:BHLH domain-containing protein n=1 Tax=Bursaphelenchus okinawaensis TaxID=465554 RepID=A0A811K895_9BILA|nr:unnamed protein product [Bursaphelenchus okinawaensis]CAG9093735.1 unnamed protein product [Bursaphelenchus okinawaensis]
MPNTRDSQRLSVTEQRRLSVPISEALMKMTMFRGFQTPSPPNYPLDRKIKKPLMEKHRRERMNKSLSHLKDKLIKHYPSETSKLEKADILEKTVFHVDRMEKLLETVQQNFNATMRHMELRFLEFLSLSSNGLTQDQILHLKQQYQMFSKRPQQLPMNMNQINMFKALPPMFMPVPFPVMPNLQTIKNNGIPPFSTTSFPCHSTVQEQKLNTTASSVPSSSTEANNVEDDENDEIDVVENDEWYSKRSDDSGIASSPEISKNQKSRGDDVWRPF